MDFLTLIGKEMPVIFIHQAVIYAALFALLLFIMIRRHKAGKLVAWRIVCILGIFSWVFFVYLSTVFSREAYAGNHLELRLFWSYERILRRHSIFMLEEVLMNLGMLVPMAFLSGLLVREKSSYKWIVLAGFLISFSIECLQLITRRGLFELDDIFHNTLGVALTCLIMKFVRFRRRNNIDKTSQKYEP